MMEQSAIHLRLDSIGLPARQQSAALALMCDTRRVCRRTKAAKVLPAVDLLAAINQQAMTDQQALTAPLNPNT